jgi:ornithine cyclodeaminase/alanine dehydrogenase-like protein (mu-crystallin family)
MLIISGELLNRLVPMDAAIACLRAGYSGHDVSQVLCPSRTFIKSPDGAAMFGSMPVYDACHDKFVVKVASFHLHNKDKGLPSIHGVVVVQDGAEGAVEAIIDATSLTALRTAATSALVADVLAPRRVDTIAMIGTGAQAAAQLTAMLRVRAASTVRVYSRERANIRRFIDARPADEAARHRFVPADSVAQALLDADIVCTATTCAAPLFAASDVRQGAHISAIGQHTTEAREFPLGLLGDALLVVEERAAAIREAGEYNRVGVEIAELLAHERALTPGRTTIFASVGTAFQDMCIAVHAAHLLKLRNASR